MAVPATAGLGVDTSQGAATAFPSIPDGLGIVFNVRAAPFYAKGDGVTDDAPAIQAAINAANGNDVVWFPPVAAGASYLIKSTLVVTDHTKLWGVGFDQVTQTGSIIKRGANIVGISATGGLINLGGAHLAHIQFRDILFEGGGFAADFINWKAVSNALIQNCAIRNCAGRALVLGEVFDTRVNNLEMEFCGNAAGTLAGLEIISAQAAGEGLNYNASNEIMFEQCRFEANPGTALITRGDGTGGFFGNKFYFVDCKFEDLASNVPALIFNFNLACDLHCVDIVTQGAAGQTITEQMQMNTCQGMRALLFLTHAGTIGVNAAALNQYVTLTSCAKVIIDVQNDDTNGANITNATQVKQVTCDFCSINGFAKLQGGLWTKELTDQTVNLSQQVLQIGSLPYVKQQAFGLTGAMYVGRIVNNGGGGTRWQLIGVKNDNVTEQIAMQIDCNTGQVTFPINVVSAGGYFANAGNGLDTATAGFLPIGTVVATSMTFGRSGVNITAGGPLKCNEAFGMAYRTSASVVAVTSADGFVGVTGTGARTVNLPAANTCRVGQVIIIQDVQGDAGIITINRAGADLINGATTKALAATAYARQMLVCDGVSNWFADSVTI